LLSRTFVPVLCYLWLGKHGHGAAPHGEPLRGPGADGALPAPPPPPRQSVVASLFARWEVFFRLGIAAYVRVLEVVLKRRLVVLGVTAVVLVGVVVGVGSQLRR